MGERKLEYKDSKGQDCYFYYSNIAGTDLDMPFYVCNAECVSGMKKRESKSETFSANPFEYEFLYAPLGDKGAYAYQQPWYGFSVNKDSEEKEIAVEFLRFMMQEKEIDEMASIKGLPSVAENGTDERYAGLRDAKNIEASFINDGSVPDSIRAALEQVCNDFGAGGVSVAIGELSDGLEINLDLVPKKYEGLDGTELAISESQERMAVVVRPEDAEKFIAAATAEHTLARLALE